MVKPDVKHNYYADLELPTSASIDDIRKAYRKLALQYHPDRNAGRESECVPKFQAIQAAHEVLGDPVVKAKYDQDRRKAGLNLPTKPGFNTPGNPYTASSNYPPPPRRTQAGTWQRPNPTTAPPPSGADRFANFARPTNTPPRKDPAADRTQQFRAWQRMNNGPERQRNNGGPPSPQPPPSTARPRPARQDTKMPSADQIRAGMNYRKAPEFNPDNAERRKSAWQSFQQQNQEEPGIRRSNTFRTPRKPGGFDPSAPGSDERPAPDAGSHYGHRHRSEDMGTPVNGSMFPPPPPPPGPPPVTPTSRRPSADPNQPPTTPLADDEVEEIPYAEANRTSTPYSSLGGEKTRFSSESLGRSASTRDTTKLHTDRSNDARARSTSPLGRRKPQGDESSDSAGAPFRGMNGDSQQTEFVSRQAQTDKSGQDVPDTAPTTGATSSAPTDRPKKKPVPRARKFNNNPTDSTQADPNRAFETAFPESETPDMQQRPSGQNMYATPRSFSSPQHSHFNRNQWTSSAFGSHSTSRHASGKASVPQWAIPSSVCPVPSSGDYAEVRGAPSCDGVPPQKPCGASTDDKQKANAALSHEERAAFVQFCHEIDDAIGQSAPKLDEQQFSCLVSNARNGHLPDHELVRLCLLDTLALYPSICVPFARVKADKSSYTHSFNFPIYHNTINPATGKSRSEENISTTFSPEGWNGTFTGVSDYFASTATGRKPSPARRPGQKPLQRASTAERTYSASSASSTMPPPPRPKASDNAQPPPQKAGPQGEIRFSKSDWEKTFQDPSWTWPPPPPNPPTNLQDPSKPNGAGVNARDAQAQSEQTSTHPKAGTRKNPYVVEDDDSTQEATGSAKVPLVEIEDDAMDIDSTPPPFTQARSSAKERGNESQASAKEPRLYAVPPSNWRQQQESQKQSKGQHTPAAASAGANLSTNLDDLSNVEPFKMDATGLNSFADLGSTLPFESKTAPSGSVNPLEPQKLATPLVPKAPEAPHKLTKSSWHAYCHAFGNYLLAFHAFNKTMLTHFEARERNAQNQMAAGMGWLEATGDTSGKLTEPSGFGSYLKGVREDGHVRQVWNIGFDRHTEAIMEFDRIRERVRYLVSTNVLLDR